MKKIFLLLQIFFCFYSFSIGQRISIANEKENVVYIGIDNPITIAVENFSGKSIIAKTNNGELLGREWRYTFRPKEIGRADIILYKKIKGEFKEIGRRSFRAKRLWDPVFKIGSGKDLISKKELLSQQFVRADFEGSDFDLRFTVISFTACIFFNDSCKYVEINNYTNELNEEIRTNFSNFKQGDFLIFKNIVVQGPDGFRNLKQVFIRIIE